MKRENASFAPASADPDSVVILKALLEAGDAFVSGSLLAKQLGISRPAVHGKLAKLREEGFEMEAVRNRGYRIVKVPELLHPSLLRSTLDRLGSKIGLLYFPVVDSTNSEADRRIASGEPSPFAVVSSCQTNGRGRLGRMWHSDSPENLYLSVLFEPKLSPHQLQHFTLWAGICICRRLESFVPGKPLKIKWPNDLHCDGRKFAGMLTEAKIDADGIRSLVFGVGLNINSKSDQFSEEIRLSATSLRSILGESLPMNDVAVAVIRSIEEAYAICVQKTDPPRALSEEWPPLDALRGQKVTAILKGAEITGIASGIDESGALLLQVPDGGIEAIRAGDVTLKK